MWQWDTHFNRNFDSLRDDPEFKALLDEIEADLAVRVAEFEGQPLP